jgi:tRNA(Ile)-lysidine synthase TilS/MesJ
MIKKNDVIGYEDKSDFRNVVLKDLLFMFAQRGIAEIVKLPNGKNVTPRAYPEKSSKKIFTKGKIAISSTIDSESNKFVHILVKGNVRDLEKIKPIDNKIIKPLYLFLDAEVLLYAKIKNLKFKKSKEKKDELSIFIDDLEKKHPEIKRAIINSYLELEN